MREFPVPEPNGIQSVLDSLPHPNARNVKPASVMDTSILEEIKKSQALSTNSTVGQANAITPRCSKGP